MLNCRQVTRLVSQSLDAELSWRQRLAVRIHLAYCIWCRRFARQVRFLRRACGELAEELDQAPDAVLSPDAKTQLRDRLREAMQQGPPPS